MDLAEYKTLYGDQDDASPGWDAIDERVDNYYAGQDPKHWGTVLSFALGGEDPLDGISAYECSEGGIDHLHFVTYGYTSLYYDEEAVGGDFSRFGFEMTFRLASPLPPDDDPMWVCGLLQNLAKYVYESGKWFADGHWIPTNSPIRLESDTELVGLAFVSDPTLEPVDSPHGKVEFIQAFGITQPEIDSLMDKSKTVADILAEQRALNPLLVTDLSRKAG